MLQYHTCASCVSCKTMESLIKQCSKLNKLLIKWLIGIKNYSFFKLLSETFIKGENKGYESGAV